MEILDKGISNLLTGDFQVADEVRENLAGIRRAAENGVVADQTRLGIFYMTQFLCTSDQDAMSYFTRAAQGGCSQAMVRLAILYNNARGVYKRDRAQAEYWLSRAATSQDSNGICLNIIWQTEPLLPTLKIIMGSFIDSVQVLDLAHREIGDVGASVLASVLPKSRIHSLYLKGNKITDQGINELAKALFNSGVQILDLWNNEVTDDGVESLSIVLPKTKIQALDLAENKITSLRALAIALPNCPSLRVLYLSRNNIGCEDAHLFAIGLEKSNIQVLDIGYNNLGASGAEVIFNGISSALQVLDLSENNAHKPGAVSIAKILPHKPNLRLLDLKKNNIGTEGGQELLDALIATKLDVLDLRQNQIDHLELEGNLHPIFPQSLTQVNLQGNGISESIIARVTRFLNRRQKKSFPCQKRDVSILVPERQVTDTLIIQKIKEIINKELDTEITVDRISYDSIKSQLYDKGVQEVEILKLLERRKIFPGMENIVVSVSFRSAEKAISKNEITPYLANINKALEELAEAFPYQEPSHNGGDLAQLATYMSIFNREQDCSSTPGYPEDSKSPGGDDFNSLSSNQTLRY